MISITEKARERIWELLDRESKRHSNLYGLRIRVTGGGCGGMQYQLGFIDQQGVDQDNDKIYNFDVTSNKETFKVIIDQESELYIDGTKLQYKDSIYESGFQFENPNASNTCGCGKSFS